MLIFFHAKRVEWESHGRANRESEKLTEFEVADRAKYAHTPVWKRRIIKP